MIQSKSIDAVMSLADRLQINATNAKFAAYAGGIGFSIISLAAFLFVSTDAALLSFFLGILVTGIVSASEMSRAHDAGRLFAVPPVDLQKLPDDARTALRLLVAQTEDKIVRVEHLRLLVAENAEAQADRARNRLSSTQMKSLNVEKDGEKRTVIPLRPE